MHDLVWEAAVGLLTGWLASLLVQGKGMGILPDMVIGILGALVGDALAQVLHIQAVGFWGNLSVAVLGAVVLLVLIRMIKSK
jgi:uncharacterized membrane protein YeaQ/YmgE (transglycosylase-associated protein family)